MQSSRLQFVSPAGNVTGITLQCIVWQRLIWGIYHHFLMYAFVYVFVGVPGVEGLVPGNFLSILRFGPQCTMILLHHKNISCCR